MLRLASVLYSIIATTLAGSCVIVALVSGYDTLLPIVVAAALGAVAAVPVAWLVARAMIGADATE
ncbi:MAG: CTP synthetase [Rhodobacterales bacterium]|nr:CTP synthetase [Rhodobacterales bacterium]